MGEGTTRTRVVTGTEAVGAFLASLPAEMRHTAFQHPNWTACWLAGEAGSDRLVVAAVVECATNGRPLLVLPLILEHYGPIGYWAPLDHGVCDYNGCYAVPDFRPTAAEMQAMWAAITAALPRRAAFLLIDKLPTAIGACHEPLAELRSLRPSRAVRHPLKLDADFATLRDTRFCQSNVRSLARKRKKLGRKGRLVFEVASGEAAIEPFERLMVWRAERYGSRPEITDFYRRLLACGDPARVASLSLDGRPISACFGLVEPKAFRLLAVGHDDAFKNWSPGLLAIEDTIAWSVDQGFDEFDFTIGSESYKFAFGAVAEPLWSMSSDFGPFGAALLRLVRIRGLMMDRIRRWAKTGVPQRRDGCADVEVAAAAE